MTSSSRDVAAAGSRIMKRAATADDNFGSRVVAKAVRRVNKPTGERYGLVLYRGSLEYKEAVHEIRHILSGDIDRPGTTHHPIWHFCHHVSSSAFALHGWCTTATERRLARSLMAAHDGEFVDV